MKRERWPKARRSSGANQRALLSSEAVLRRAGMGWSIRRGSRRCWGETAPRACRPFSVTQDRPRCHGRQYMSASSPRAQAVGNIAARLRPLVALAGTDIIDHETSLKTSPDARQPCALVGLAVGASSRHPTICAPRPRIAPAPRQAHRDAKVGPTGLTTRVRLRASRDSTPIGKAA